VCPGLRRDNCGNASASGDGYGMGSCRGNSVSLPSPLVGEGVASRSEATGEGFLRPNELGENVLQNDRRPLQDVIVPVACDSEPFSPEKGFSGCIAPRRCMLTAIDLNDGAPFEANEVENERLKGSLTAKFEPGQASIAQQSPHGGLGVGRLPTHFPCEIADAFGCRSMVRCLLHQPLTRRLRRHPLPQGERVVSHAAVIHTRIGIST